MERTQEIEYNFRGERNYNIKNRYFSSDNWEPLQFNKCIHTSVDKEDFLLPLCAKFEFSRQNVTTFIIPFNEFRHNTKKIVTMSTGLWYGMGMVINNQLTKIKVEAKTYTREFYTGQGIILTDTFEPLMHSYIKGHYNKEEDKYSYDNITVKFNPKIFSNPDDNLYKVILKELLPSLVGLKLNYNLKTSSKSKLISVYTLPIHIEIDSECTNIFHKVPAPTPSTFSNEALNQLLKDNVDLFK